MKNMSDHKIKLLITCEIDSVKWFEMNDVSSLEISIIEPDFTFFLSFSEWMKIFLLDLQIMVLVVVWTHMWKSYE